MDDALNHFADKWKYGMSILRDSVTEAGQALITVSQRWQGTEQGLAAGISGATTGATADPTAIPGAP
jgi:hypothetical protein